MTTYLIGHYCVTKYYYVTQAQPKEGAKDTTQPNTPTQPNEAAQQIVDSQEKITSQEEQIL